MNNSAAHTALVREILLRLGREPDLLLWQNTTGSFREPFSERRINVGLPGSPDIIGILRSVTWRVHDDEGDHDITTGRFVGLEVKTGAAKLSDQQKNFHARATELGALICVVHSVDEAVAAIDAARGAR